MHDLCNRFSRQSTEGIHGRQQSMATQDTALPCWLISSIDRTPDEKSWLVPNYNWCGMARRQCVRIDYRYVTTINVPTIHLEPNFIKLRLQTHLRLCNLRQLSMTCKNLHAWTLESVPAAFDVTSPTRSLNLKSASIRINVSLHI